MNDPSHEYGVIAERALGWIVEHREEFRLPATNSPLFTKMLKPLGELALTAGVLRRSAFALPRAAVAEELLELCWSELREGSLLVEIVRDEPSLLSLAAIYLPLREAGMRHVQFERTLRSLALMRGVARLEYPPWRQLELAVSLRALEIPSPWDADAAYANTWLAAKPEPWMLSTEAAYSLTHTVFYRTDFGRFPDRILEADFDYLVRWLPVWFEYFAVMGDFDIAAELIIVARCIAVPDPDDWGAQLYAHQDEDGMVPGPPIYGGGLDPTATEPLRKSFLSNYHTTLVALIAAALSSSHGRG